MAPHYGVDMAAPRGHRPSARRLAGVWSVFPPISTISGGLILIDHGQGVSTAHLHQSKPWIIAQGEWVVARGQAIGLIGTTGRATGPHLHWALNLVSGVRIGPFAFDAQAHAGSSLSDHFTSSGEAKPLISCEQTHRSSGWFALITLAVAALRALCAAWRRKIRQKAWRTSGHFQPNGRPAASEVVVADQECHSSFELAATTP